MFRGHFFFGKMEKVELEPLKPEQMVEAYRKRFKTLGRSRRTRWSLPPGILAESSAASQDTSRSRSDTARRT
jgi:hypothetical protein